MTRRLSAFKQMALAPIALILVLCMLAWVFAGWALMLGLLIEFAAWPWWIAVPVSFSTWWLGVCGISYYMEF